MAGASKTAKKSSPQAKEGKFLASGELSRFVPLQGGYVYFRNPETGGTEHLTHAQAAVRIQEMENHPLSRAMHEDLKQIIINYLAKETARIADGYVDRAS